MNDENEDTEQEEEPQTYFIKRHYAPHLSRESHAVEGLSGLTLEEAKAHCASPHTKGEGWFDAFHKE